MKFKGIEAIIEEIEAAIGGGVSFEASPRRAIGLALRLGCVVAVSLADIAANLREIKTIFEEEAKREA